MKNIFKNKDFKISMIFSLIALIASVFVASYQLSTFSESLKTEIFSQIGSPQALIAIASLQGALLTFISSFMGLKLARRVNLKLNFNYKFDKDGLIKALILAFLVALIITGSDRFIFTAYIPSLVREYRFSSLYFISGILYGGIIEEILLRLLVMSFLVLIIWKLFASSSDKLTIPAYVYISAIILAALLFAAGHIPLTIQTIGMSTPILIRCFLLNGIGGLAFGYLYWKKGLYYSMIAHGLTHVFMQAILMPIFF